MRWPALIAFLIATLFFVFLVNWLMSLFGAADIARILAVSIVAVIAIVVVFTSGPARG